MTKPQLLPTFIEMETADSRIIETLKLYADPANWTSDGKFRPVMQHIDVDDPYGPARDALARSGQ